MIYTTDFYITTLGKKYEHDEKLQILKRIIFDITTAFNKNPSADINLNIDNLNDLLALKIAICVYGETSNQEYLTDAKEIIHKISPPEGFAQAKEQIENSENNPIVSKIIHLLLTKKWISSDTITHVKKLISDFESLDSTSDISDLHAGIDDAIIEIQAISKTILSIIVNADKFKDEIIAPVMAEIMTPIANTIKEVGEKITANLNPQKNETISSKKIYAYVQRRMLINNEVEIYLMKLTPSLNYDFFEFDQTTTIKLIVHKDHMLADQSKQALWMRNYSEEMLDNSQALKDSVTAKHYVKATSAQGFAYKTYDSIQEMYDVECKK